MKPLEKLPTPLACWVLVKKVKKGSGLILPDTSADAFDFFVLEPGPDVTGIEEGDRIELMPRLALASGVMLDDNHALIQSSSIVAVYR